MLLANSPELAALYGESIITLGVYGAGSGGVAGLDTASNRHGHRQAHRHEWRPVIEGARAEQPDLNRRQLAAALGISDRGGCAPASTPPE